MSTAASWPISYCTLDRSPLFGLPETLHEQIDAAAGAGFAYVTLDMFALRAYVGVHGSLQPLAERVDQSGLRVCDIAGSNVSADRDAALTEATELAGYAAAVGAQWLQARITAPLDAAETLDTYRQCAAAVADAGVGFALEFSPFTPIDSLVRAREVLDDVRGSAPRQGIVIDTWHLHYTDPLDSLLSTPADDIAFIQLSDVVTGTDATTNATLNQRALPGEGVASLDRCVDALEKIGFDGVVSVEVLSAALRSMELDAYVDATLAATAKVLGQEDRPARIR